MHPEQEVNKLRGKNISEEQAKYSTFFGRFFITLKYLLNQQRGRGGNIQGNSVAE